MYLRRKASEKGCPIVYTRLITMTVIVTSCFLWDGKRHTASLLTSCTAHFWLLFLSWFSFLFCYQGEKAYSCEQCGTRFTYRNGLIKHKKLNRCPKKIITPEGETIIKKRSRTFAASSSNASIKKEALKPIISELVPPQTSTSSLPSQPPSHGSASLEPTTPGQAAQSSSVNGTLLVQNNYLHSAVMWKCLFATIT